MRVPLRAAHWHVPLASIVCAVCAASLAAGSGDAPAKRAPVAEAPRSNKLDELFKGAERADEPKHNSIVISADDFEPAEPEPSAPKSKLKPGRVEAHAGAARQHQPLFKHAFAGAIYMPAAAHYAHLSPGGHALKKAHWQQQQLHALLAKPHLFHNAEHSALASSASVNAGHATALHALLAKEQALAKFGAPDAANSIDVDAPTGAKPRAPAAELLGPELCGRQQAPAAREPRIVGGNSTHEGEFPWAVSVQRHGSHHCGGVIVARRWILTAAHCVRSQSVASLLVRTGGHALQQRAAGQQGARDHAVDQIIMHDDFNRLDNLQPAQALAAAHSASATMKSAANTANNADIALLRLRNDIQLNEFAWPVCFPGRDAGNFSGHEAVVIGWGKLSEKSEEFSNELQKVKLTIIDNKVCQNWFRQAGRDMPIDERIICAGFKQGGKDACHGDSGGPLLSRMSSGRYAVVGVVSTGIGCARPLLPGLYSRVSSYVGWIEAQIAAAAAAAAAAATAPDAGA